MSCRVDGGGGRPHDTWGTTGVRRLGPFFKRLMREQINLALLHTRVPAGDHPGAGGSAAGGTHAQVTTGVAVVVSRRAARPGRARPRHLLESLCNGR